MPGLRLLLFETAQWGCCLYALFRGGRAERWAAASYLVGSALTTLAMGGIGQSTLHFRHVETGMFLVDVLAFCAFLAVALSSDKFWPMWLAAMQGVVVLSHGALLGGDDVLPRAYANAVALWNYPILFLIAWATFRRRREAQGKASSS